MTADSTINAVKRGVTVREENAEKGLFSTVTDLGIEGNGQYPGGDEEWKRPLEGVS